LASSANCGETSWKSCIMTEALMYGFNPKAAIEKLAKVPPEKISKRDKSWFWEKKLRSNSKFTPGTGTWAINLNRIRTPSVNKILLRSKGVFKPST